MPKIANEFGLNEDSIRDVFHHRHATATANLYKKVAIRQELFDLLTNQKDKEKFSGSTEFYIEVKLTALVQPVQQVNRNLKLGPEEDFEKSIQEMKAKVRKSA